MTTCAKRLRVPAISLLLAACVLLPSHVTVKASDPHGAYYSADTDRVFWFIHASDLHIGTSGSNDSSQLQWLVTTAKSVITPQFIVVTGDLTDSTNGNIFGYPNGPYQAEWDQYNSILTSAGVDASWFYDLPGNHDAYSDRYFSYYLNNSVQGLATGNTQLSWRRDFDFGKYHFLGVNSAGNDGAAFSLIKPWGDNAGLDGPELTFINQQLEANNDADLTFVFGHHPISSTGDSDDTWLSYGQGEFITALNGYAASTYNYGHTHRNSQALFTGNNTMPNGGVHYYNVASLGKDSPNSYSLVAIDCHGVSSTTRTVGSWPLVLITAPLDRHLGGAVNPYAYNVPAASANPIRALVFDEGTVSQVSYRIDNDTNWHSMTRVAESQALWQGTWNASGLTGDHTIEVQAVGTTTVSDVITVKVETGSGNRAPAAANDSYSVFGGQTLNVAAPGVLANDSDPDGNPLTAGRLSVPAHGQFSFSSSGSFAYTPTASYSGPDSFTYAASDGTLSSNTATVSITVTAPDVVTIVSASYNTRRKQLSVTAQSSVQPNATLTLVGYGQMSYKTKTKTYVLTATVSQKPTSVSVTSNRGGSATVPVS